MKHIKRLQNIEHEVFITLSDCSQIVIDLIQNTIIDLQEKIGVDELGSAMYKTTNILDVIKLDNEHDIELLNDFYSVLKDWQNDL